MAKREPIKVVGYLIMEDGSTKRLEDLTQEEREAWEERWHKRFIDNMSLYFKQHPEEFEQLPLSPVQYGENRYIGPGK